MMNVKNYHILKTWLSKARATEDNRPVLCYANLFNPEPDVKAIFTADGYRAHITNHIPAKLGHLEVDKDRHNAIEIFDPDTDTPRREEAYVCPDMNRILAGAPTKADASFDVNPQMFMSRIKWAINHNPGMDFIRVSAVRGECLFEIKQDDETWREVAPRMKTFFYKSPSIYVVPRYLLDAIWIHYYQYCVSISVVDPGIVKVNSPRCPNYALIMCANGWGR